MDELDLAKGALHRGYLSEEQLREAQSFASGGRSLLSVLLDLGYLRHDQIAEILPHRPAPPRSPLPTLALMALAAVVGGMLALGFVAAGRSRETFREPHPPVVVHEFKSIERVLIQRAALALRTADEEWRRDGTLSAESERRVVHAAELLSEAISQGASDAATFTQLGQAHEMLDHWETASDWYRKALRMDDRDPAPNLGLARLLLLLGRPLQALEHATRSAAGTLAGEAFLVRAKAQLNLGHKSDARADLDLALQKDPSLAVQVRALRIRIDD